jgi:two-component system NarL family sensor kinase
MADSPPDGAIASLRREWGDLGGLGQLAVFGLVLAVIVTVVLGFSITRAARGHLLDARAVMIEGAVNALPLYPVDRDPTASELAALDADTRIHVLGGDTVRVKLWAPDGTIVYSDEPSLMGQQFDLLAPAAAAFAGEIETRVSDLGDPAHAFDRGHGELIEYYVPIVGDSGSVRAVYEVEQDVAALDDALGRIARNVWLSIGLGIFVLGLLMAVFVIARTREITRQRRAAEELLRSALRVQETERRQIVGALHDDIGQPMYRVLYGLEGSRAKLEPGDPIADELGHLEGIVRAMDDTLRSELRVLQFELAADAGLNAALSELAGTTRSEAGMDVSLTVELSRALSEEESTEMYRAAREAVTNVRKHSAATQMSIAVRDGPDGRVTLEVVDDGRGSEGRDGLGLSTTRQRLEAMGGGLEVVSSRRAGTRFRAWLPHINGGQQ